jgi:probable F420-dependent oxidoreductase
LPTTPAPLGITIPLDAPLPEHAKLLPRLAEAGYAHFWTSETAGFDAFTPAAYAAPLLPADAQFGTAIASVFTRGPALLAMSAAALADAAPGRFRLGIGAASPAIVTSWNGIPYERPLWRVRQSVEFLRAALAGEKVNSEAFGVTGFRLDRPPAAPPPILLAALRPAMLRLAGEVGDGAILNWLSAEDVAKVVPFVHEGGPDKQIVARIFVCPTDDALTTRLAARRVITGYLTVPGYAAFHRWLGREDQLGDVWAAWAAGDRKAAVAAVGDPLINDLLVIGTPAECAAHVARYAAAGVQVPVLSFIPLDRSRDVLADAVAIAHAYHGAG